MQARRIIPDGRVKDSRAAVLRADDHRLSFRLRQLAKRIEQDRAWAQREARRG
jgi:hypothetical protein